MIQQKHLNPYLLIYLIATILLLLTSIGIVIVIILNDINGFNFISGQYLSCLPSTLNKFSSYIVIILKTDFIFSILSVIFALGQCGIVIWQFINFKKQCAQNRSNQDNVFQSLSLMKLIVLYILNFCGILSLVTIVGSFGSLYIEYNKCSDPQNKSSSYLIPEIIAIAALIFQILSLCMSLKLFYHLSDEEEINLQKSPVQSPEAREKRKILQKQEMNAIKKKMLQSRGNQQGNVDNNGKGILFEDNYYSSSTNQQSPRQGQVKLLNKDPYNNNYQNKNNGNDSIYANSNNKSGSNNNVPTNKYSNNYQTRGSNKIDPNVKNNPNQSNKNNPNQNSNLNNSSRNSNKSNSTNINQRQLINQNQNKNNKSSTQQNSNNQGNIVSNNGQQLSPSSISQKQKQVMKKLPKHPYKKNNKKSKPNDVIFQQPGSQQQGSQYHYGPNQQINNSQPNAGIDGNTNSKQKNQPQYINQNNQKYFQSPQKGKKNQSKQQKKNQQKQSQNINRTNSSIKSFDSISSPNQTLSQNQSPQSKNQVLRFKYFNSHYLKHLQNKNVTPQQRRNIKRPFLALTSSILQFDAKNYQIEDFILEDDITSLDKFDRKKSKNAKIQTQSNSDSKLLNLPQNKNGNGGKQSSINDSNDQLNISIGDFNVFGGQKKITSSRSAAYLLQKSIIQAQNLQDQNPIVGYIDEDQNYQNQLTKIIAFDKLSKKRRRNIYNPFQNYYQQMDSKQNQGKLYLHKNKRDGHGKGVLLTQNEETLGYDPFRDQSFEDEMPTQRALTTQDDINVNVNKNNMKSDKKLLKQNQISVPSQTKKASRKDGMLLDFIRSKHVTD